MAASIHPRRDSHPLKINPFGSSPELYESVTLPRWTPVISFVEFPVMFE